jgi:hypothetical protein
MTTEPTTDDASTGRELKRRMVGAWLACLAPPLAAGVPLAFTANPPAPYGAVVMISLVATPLLLWRAYGHHTEWSAHDEVQRAVASLRGYADVFLPRRHERWPSLVEAGTPPLEQWLSPDKFRKFSADDWHASRPFEGVAGGLRVSGVTARLTTRYRSRERHGSMTSRSRTHHIESFAGLALRTETSRPVEASATLYPMRRGWLGGAWDRLMHAEPSSYGRRIITGDAGFDARFALHGDERGPLVPARGWSLLDRLMTRHGPVTVAWRGREIVMAVECGADWDESERGVDVLQDALALIAELAAARA